VPSLPRNLRGLALRAVQYLVFVLGGAIAIIALSIRLPLPAAGTRAAAYHVARVVSLHARIFFAQVKRSLPNDGAHASVIRARARATKIFLYVSDCFTPRA